MGIGCLQDNSPQVVDEITNLSRCIHNLILYDNNIGVQTIQITRIQMHHIQNADYYHHFLIRLNKYRSDHNKSMVWLDRQIFFDHNYHADKFESNFISSQIQSFTSLTMLTTDSYDQHSTLLDQQFNHVSMYLNTNSNILNLIFTRRLFAVDSLEVKEGVCQLNIISLNHEYSLWGLKVYFKSSTGTNIYGPNFIKKHHREHRIKIKQPGALQVYAVSGDVIYGKMFYYHGLPEDSVKVYQIYKIEPFESLLDQIVIYENQRRTPKGLFQMKKNVTSNFVNPFLLKSNLKLNLESPMTPLLNSNWKTPIRTPLKTSPILTSPQEQPQQSIFDPNFNLFCKKQNMNLPLFNGSINSSNIFNNGNIFHNNFKNKFNEDPLIIVNQSLQTNKPLEYFPEHLITNKEELFRTVKSLTLEFFQKNREQCNKTAHQYITISCKGTSIKFNRSVFNKFSELCENNEIVLNSVNAHAIKFVVQSFTNYNSTQYFSNLSLQIVDQILSAYNLLKIKKQYLFVEKILLFGIIPKLNYKLWLKFIVQIFKNKEKNIADRIIYKFWISYFRKYSRQLFNNFEDQLMVTLRQLPVNIIYKLVSVALQSPHDINHVMDMLSILTNCDFGNNIIEVMEKISNGFPDKQFIKRSYDLPALQSLQNCYLIKNPKVNQILESYIQDQIPITKQVKKQQGLDLVYQLLVNRLKCSEKRWLLISQNFEYADRAWKLLIEFDNGSICAFIQERGQVKSNYNLLYTSCLIHLEISIDSIMHSSNVFYSFSNNQDDTVGLKIARNYSHEDFRLEAKVYFLSYTVHGSILHHLNIRWKDLIKASSAFEEQGNKQINRRVSMDMGKRKSCVILEQNLISEAQQLSFESMFQPPKRKQGIMSLYDINQYNLYYLFKNQSLQINQSILLLYLCKYYIFKSQDYDPLPLLALKYNYISLKCLLSVSLYHPTLKYNQLYCRLLEGELEERFVGSNKVQKPRKNAISLKQEGVAKEMVQWLKSEHFNTFKKKLNMARKMQDTKINKEQKKHVYPDLGEVEQTSFKTRSNIDCLIF